MKRYISIVISLAMLISALSGINSYAVDDEITVEFDGKIIEFDVKPQIINGYTMVPVRKIFEEFGALVKWNDDEQKVSARKNSKTITLNIGSNEIEIDKGKTDDEGNPVVEIISVETPAQLVSGRTLVPVRAISESFGYNVDWNKDNQKVVITSDNDSDDSWKENVASIDLTDLTFDGEGIEIEDNQITITAGGDYTLTGTLDDGNIIISTKEKVKLRLEGVSISSSENPCIFVEKADKAYITISENSKNYLVAENSEDGVIYSKENLEIKGNGSLDINSIAGHGIKASDNLNIENGNITINALSDGIHINDTFKMSGGKVGITAIGDGIDSESIVNISGGEINIQTNGAPIESTQATDAENSATRRPMWEENTGVEFEKSTKGISAEWMMVISGGVISVNSASHAIHCQDEIEINGGNIALSSQYDKGISAHGNLTISGSETVIDVLKSTEGIESKNVMTINDGVIKIISSDDAINATGGSSGMMPPGGNFGQMPDRGNQQKPEAGQASTRPGRGRNNNSDGTGSSQANPEEGMPPIGEGGFPGGEMPPQFNPKEGMPPFGEGGFPGGEMPPKFNPEEGMPPFGEGGFPGGMGRNMKECLVINGGYLELYGEDDCLDSNGNLSINGGTIKATNPTGSFYGAFGIVDPDGQAKISEDATLIFAANNGSERNLNLKQNAIIVHCESVHKSGDKITISDLTGNVMYEYNVQGNFKSVLIASPSIKNGEKYIVTIGDETFETEITQQTTVLGTQQNGGMGFGRGSGEKTPRT